MTRTTYSKTESTTVSVSSYANKTIVLPFDKPLYATVLEDSAAYKAYVSSWIETHPELFPDTIETGWSLHGFTRPSAKFEGLRQRRILTHADGEVWQIRPAFVMPYMTCATATAEKILLLAKWAPDWALAQAFEQDEGLVYRLRVHFGRYSLVGTTIKSSVTLPSHVAADEKHSYLTGERIYLPTTVGHHCFLGIGVSLGAGEAELTDGYRQFQEEAQHVAEGYQPETVNTDGWQATINAWKTLFPTICVIQCFLHAVLSIKRVASKATMIVYEQIAEVVWQAYRAPSKRSFAQRLRRVREWGETLSDGALKKKLLKLCEKRAWFTPAYDFRACLRTSNMVDRLMQGLDKSLFAKQYLHGTVTSAHDSVRSYCLLTNFRPYNPTTAKTLNGIQTPFERVNGWSYHTSWLQNLLIATSRQDIYRFQHKLSE